MDKEAPIISVASQSKEKVDVVVSSDSMSLRKRLAKAPLRMWLLAMGVVGLVLLGLVSSVVGYWLQNVQSSIGQSAKAPPITTFKVQRTSLYAGLDITVVNAQYATSFSDDTILSGIAIVRLNMLVTNPGTDPAKVVYYDVARLLVPKQKTLSPTNVHLSVGPKPHTSETGWVDFAVPEHLDMSSLTLQLGSTTMHETLVTIPFSGPFNPNRYASKVSTQRVAISYDFLGSLLTYHLVSVEVRYAYQGNQSKAGQQFYVLNFQVENENGRNVSPGFGYDYVRLVINGDSRPPIDTTLPSTFNAGAKAVAGHIVFVGPVGMKVLTIGLLPQTGGAQQNTSISI